MWVQMAIPEKAQTELIAALRSAADGLMTINSLQTYNTEGCACSSTGPCAYHADLINRIMEGIKRLEGVVGELQKDIREPGRKV